MRITVRVAAVAVAFLISSAVYASTVDLSVTSTGVTPSTITLGTGNMQYTVNLFNASGVAATNAAFTANLPASSTFVSATPTGAGGSCSGTGPVTCNWATYPSGASFSVTIVVTPGVAGANTLTSNISSADTDPNTGNNNGSGTITVNDQIDLAVFSMSGSPSSITLGTGNATYTISLYNWSSSKATNAQLSITLPASSTFVSATPTGAGGSCSGTGPVTCNWADYPSGASYSVTVVVTPGAPGTNTLSASISATQPDPDNVTANHLNSGNASVTVNDQIDLAVFSMSGSPSSITLGTGNATYTVSLYNWSSSKATNAQVNITLPASSTFVSATPTGAGGSCSGTGPVTCNWADYPSGASFSVTVIVTPGIPGTNTLSASISADQPDPDNVTANHLNSGNASVTVNDQIDLAVFSMSGSPSAITLGTGNATYTVNLYNWSSSKATNAQVNITLPASSTFVSATPTGAGGSCSGTGPVTCNWADYPSGASFSVTVVVTPGIPGTNTLSASISATQPDPDNVTANHLNSGNASVTVNDQIDLAVFSMSGSPSAITLGTGNATYTISLFNWSSSKATNAQLSITLPASSTFVSATPTGAGGSCSGTGPVTCNWADYPSGASFSVTVVVTPGIPGTNTLSASISATQPDPDNVTANHLNSGNASVTVNDQIDLAVFSMSGSPSAITLATGNVTYTISLFNWSSSKATNAQLSITLPASSTFVSATPTGAGGSCSGTGPVTCNWADYPSGASYSVTVVVTPGAAGTNTLSASISATQPDPDNVTANHLNSGNASVTVNDQIDLAVFSIGDSPDPRTLGAGNVTYTISLFNWSSSKATNAQLTITLPASSGFVSATPTGAGGSCSGTGPVTCNWADYPSGASYSVTVVVTPGVAGTNTLNATLTATQNDPDEVTASHLRTDTETTTINPSSAPTITGFSPSSGSVNQPVTISGANFTGTTSVKFFNNVTAAFTVVSDSTITTNVPSGATTGAVTITNAIGPTTSGSSFTVIPGIVVTNTNDSGSGSLRDAIAQANSGACPSACTIRFSIGSGLQTITPTSTLPNIAAANVTIDGTTQPGYSGTPLIELNGASAGPSARGLTLAAGGAVVKGLVIRGYNAVTIPFGYGIYITSANNTVKGNYIGTNAAGTAASPNRVGIVLDTAAATGNTIGGLTAADRNIISGNSELGISIANGPSNNTVAGNYIGTNAAGTADLGHGFQGVSIAYSSNNVIGGTTANARNVISGNDAQGILIYASTATGNAIQGNYIGTDATGSFAIGNTLSGVSIETASTGNFVGGTSAGAGNLISGNGGDGVRITDPGTNGNFVQGNTIGLNAGAAALANALAGVRITSGSQSNTIGGTSASARNVISGNTNQGIAILGSLTNNNTVQGNYIGTNPAGSAAAGNNTTGIGIWGGAQNNTIGGTSASARNVISGNLQDGIAIRDTNTSSNTVAGNYIGTDATGSFLVSNGWYGVDIFSAATTNTIGGNVPNAMNLISGNALGGVLLSDAGTTGNVVGSNWIGLNATASGAISNAGPGVRIASSAAGNDIGSSSSPNKIAFNMKGVVLANTAGIGNRINANTIAQNTTIGIDLNNDGVTANDGTDGDTGPNNLQNYPVINSATLSGGTSLDFNLSIDSSGSSPSVGLKFEIFKADTSSPEQGAVYLGTTTCQNATLSNVTFNLPVAGLTAGNKIVATATSYTDNTCTAVKDGTSEFSAAATVVQAQGALSITKTAPASVVAGQTFNYTLQVKNVGPYPAENVSVSDNLPAGLVWNSTTAPGFTCGAPPNIVCTATSFAVTTTNITINVTAPGSPTSINNTATITATNDSTAGDDSSNAVTSVTTASADVSLTKSVSPGSVAFGGGVTYTITVQNNGPSPASSVVVSDPLPAGQTATTATLDTGLVHDRHGRELHDRRDGQRRDRDDHDRRVDQRRRHVRQQSDEDADRGGFE